MAKRAIFWSGLLQLRTNRGGAQAVDGMVLRSTTIRNLAPKNPFATWHKLNEMLVTYAIESQVLGSSCDNIVGLKGTENCHRPLGPETGHARA